MAVFVPVFLPAAFIAATAGCQASSLQRSSRGKSMARTEISTQSPIIAAKVSVIFASSPQMKV